MSKKDQAVSCFRRGYNCSQAVFSTFSPDLGLAREKALRIAGSFGGGMGRMGETCGAVSGAFMAIGLKYGAVEAVDIEAKEKAYGMVEQFVTRFEARHEGTRCKDLLGYDISSQEGRNQARDEGLFDNLCPKFVGDAAEILEEIL